MYHTVKNFRGKNFGELQQFAKFFANFHYFHNIPYANNLQFANVFSTKLPTVFICQTFLLPTFLYTIPMIIFLVQSHKYCKIMKAHVLMHYNYLSTAYKYHVPLDWSWAKYKIYCVDNYHILILIVLFDLFQSL